MMWEALAWVVLWLAGVSVGATAIGGVLVVPVLTLMLGYDTSSAIAAASLAFLFTGLFALWRHPAGWRGVQPGDPWLMGAALLGAVLGACMADIIPPDWVRGWIGVLALGSGLQTMWRLATRARPEQSAQRDWPTSWEQSLVGAMVGLGSALSGTGGPVMLMPYLLLTRRDMRRSVATALVLQVPIGLAASVTHAWAGRSQLGLGVLLAGVLVAGIWGGQWLAHRTPLRGVMGVLAFVLAATGLWLLGT